MGEYISTKLTPLQILVVVFLVSIFMTTFFTLKSNQKLIENDSIKMKQISISVDKLDTLSGKMKDILSNQDTLLTNDSIRMKKAEYIMNELKEITKNQKSILYYQQKN